jgi:hypothetical protein
MVDACGIPLGTLAAPANCHDSPLLAPTLDALQTLGGLPEPVSVHLDRAYDSNNVVRRLLEERGLEGAISKKGTPDPLGTTKRWVVERTNSWTNVHKKLSCGVPSAGGGSSTSGSPFPTRSSSWGGSSVKPGPTTAGKAGLPADPDLLAQALSTTSLITREPLEKAFFEWSMAAKS